MRTNGTATQEVWIGYCRVSTGKQAESGLSLEAQERLLKAEADRRGVDLRIVVEQASGGSVSGRPILRQALTDLSNGEAAGLIATKLDRLARSLSDYCRMVEQAEGEGWSLLTLDSPVDPTTPMGKAFTSIIATFAELERGLIAERTRTAMGQAKANGRRLGGARSERSAELAARVNGMKQAGMKFREICDTLTSEGEPTLRGGAAWRPSNVQALLRAYENDQLAGVSVV
jgi:DNA invertase Pin-like site-specific DNA recombinase